jgi:nitrogen fixation/metabolism regulation signal transduction histidine kinase
MGTVAAGIAHEIRNPLSTLRINLQLLREDWENPITEREQKGRKRIDVLLRETERLDAVVSGLVRFASGHAPRLERTNLNTLAGELLDFLAPQAERARIRLIRDFAKDLPPVDVDPNLIRQAILNLLVNAQQVLPSGGEIRIRTQENGQTVKLSVGDNGPGIPAEHRDKIFNLYFSTKPGGTGLGLPTVKKIVEGAPGDHRGRHRTPEGNHVHDMPEKIRVLVIDDDGAHAEAAAESLARSGYDCSVATSGTEGLQRLENDGYDVVLTDLVMRDFPATRSSARSRPPPPRPKSSS